MSALSPAATRAEEPWLIEDTRNPLGDHNAWFWAPDRNGYTADVSKAGRYTQAQAEAQARSRSTDRAWPLSAVLALARPTVERDTLHCAAAPAPSTPTTERP